MLRTIVNAYSICYNITKKYTEHGFIKPTSATAGSSSSPTTSNSQKLKKAYDVFKHVGESHALKVIIENDISE